MSKPSKSTNLVPDSSQETAMRSFGHLLLASGECLSILQQRKMPMADGIAALTVLVTEMENQLARFRGICSSELCGGDLDRETWPQ